MKCPNRHPAERTFHLSRHPHKPVKVGKKRELNGNEEGVEWERKREMK
jgi:hypothetical protein